MHAKRTETEIDLLDLLKVILYKWRQLLVWMIVFAILAGGFRVYKNVKTNKAIDAENASLVASETTEEEEIVLEETDDKYLMETKLMQYARNTDLTDIQVSNVKNALNMYNILEQYYAQLGDDYADIDYSNENRVVLQYVVKVKSGQINPSEGANAVVYALNQYIGNGGMAAAIVKAGYDGAPEIELSDLIVCGGGAAANADTGTIQFSTDIADGDTRASVVPFSVTCKGNEASEAKKLAKYIKEELTKYITTYENLGNAELILLDEYLGQVSDTSVLSERQSITQTIANLYNQFISFTNNFNDQQKALFDIVKEDNILEVSDSSLINTITSNGVQSSEILETKPHISLSAGMVKDLLIGLFIGLVLAVIWDSILYIFDGKIKSEKEFEKDFGCFNIGNISVASQHAGFGSFVDNILDKVYVNRIESIEERERLTCANVKALCHREGINTVCISSTLLGEEDKNQIEKVIALLEKEGISTKYVGNVLKSVSGFEEMIACGVMILAERENCTKVDEMNRLAIECEKHKVKVLGEVSL